jgi:predicted ABC-type ATPase
MNGPGQPTCLIIAGPNGAGKTTFALKYLPEMGCQQFVNADLIAAGCRRWRRNGSGWQRAGCS